MAKFFRLKISGLAFFLPSRPIILRKKLGFYSLRDLPIHKSQHEIGQGENFSDFELYMRPTIDFSGHLLSRGSLIKVLQPQWLAGEIHDMHLEAAAMYEPGEEEQGE